LVVRLVRARRFAEKPVAPIGGGPIAPATEKACACFEVISSCSATESDEDCVHARFGLFAVALMAPSTVRLHAD